MFCFDLLLQLKEMKSQLKKERAKQKMLEEEFASPQAKGSHSHALTVLV